MSRENEAPVRPIPILSNDVSSEPAAAEMDVPEVKEGGGDEDDDECIECERGGDRARVRVSAIPIGKSSPGQGTVGTVITVHIH